MRNPSLFRPLRGCLAAVVVLASSVVPGHAQSGGGPTVSNLSVVIVSPTNGQFFTAPTNIAIRYIVHDYGAYPNKISLYSGTNLIVSFNLGPAEPDIVPWAFTWTNVQMGAYSLTLVVNDSAGLTATSAPVNITVTNGIPPPPLPVVTIFATDPIASVCTNFPYFPPVTAAAAYISGTNTATFLVRRTGATNSSLTVDYSIGGTASNGVDYIMLPGDVTIPAGRRFALITIVPKKAVHPIARPYLTVILALTEPPVALPILPGYTPSYPYIIGWPGKAEAIILEECGVPVPVTGVLPDATFNVCLPGTNGMNFCLQVSTDLVNWTPVCTNTVVKGCIPFLDPEAGSYGNRYYRAVPAAGPALY